jgi:hypothetical protein
LFCISSSSSVGSIEESSAQLIPVEIEIEHDAPNVFQTPVYTKQDVIAFDRTKRRIEIKRAVLKESNSIMQHFDDLIWQLQYYLQTDEKTPQDLRQFLSELVCKI